MLQGYMNLKNTYLTMVIICCLSLTIYARYIQPVDSTQTEKTFYAIQVNDVLCGYSEATESMIAKDGKNFVEQKSNMFIMLSLLGSAFNSEMNSEAVVDPETRRCMFMKTKVKQASVEMSVEMTLQDGKAIITSSTNNQKKEIEITPDIIAGSDEMFSRLKRDIYEKMLTEISYDILEIIEGEVQNSSFKKIKEEKVDLAGKTYNTIVIEQVNNKTGRKTTYWLSPENDYFVMFEVQQRKVYLADQSVVDKIKVANMDENIFTKANVSISDIQSIEYIKVNAVIEPTGKKLSFNDLNVPGQKFTGSVVNNHIEGIFEISYKKYNGENADKFPPENIDESIKKYLTAEDRIESNDPVLIDKAKEITAGAKDSWEAAVRLSKWVAENIHYAIPGGGTPRKTYDIRAGECGAHSFLLATFCRSVGIPARVVWGAMYAPNNGGGFGQHAWNEIYMSNAGWIPVDATAFECDFVDAGHIRISEYQSLASSFNGKKFEVLDYKLTNKEKTSTENAHSKYYGKYTNIESGKTFTILEKEGNLSLDIPGQMVLPLNEPDEKGRWICKISPGLYLEFAKDKDEEIEKFTIHEIIPLTKKSSQDSIPNDVPENLKLYLGKYLFAAVNLDFTVLYKDGALCVYEPIEKGTIKLQMPNKEGGWIDEQNKNTIYFEKDSKENITGLKIDVANYFIKGDLASEVVEKIYRAEGIESAVKKYMELKTTRPGKTIITEGGYNLLGYKLLNEGKLKDAIEIFKLNSEAYPESFNVYDSLGEAYMKNNQTDLAIENYKKSLELNDKNENAKKMLEKLSTK